MNNYRVGQNEDDQQLYLHNYKVRYPFRRVSIIKRPTRRCISFTRLTGIHWVHIRLADETHSRAGFPFRWKFWGWKALITNRQLLFFLLIFCCFFFLISFFLTSPLPTQVYNVHTYCTVYNKTWAIINPSPTVSWEEKK